jgi:glycosyltransferase involved in cell wall biosynthesis
MLVSVVITCYNLEKYIGRCIESVINQTYNNLEIIVVNDCSTDNSLKVIKEFAKRDNRIKIVNLRKNHGCGYAKKTGGDKAIGDYITFVDADDYILPDYIEMNVNKAIEDNSQLVLSYQIMFSEPERKFVKFRLSPTSAFFINTMFLSKNLYNKLQFSTLRYFEDYAIMPRLWYYGKDSVSYIDDYRGYVYDNLVDGICKCDNAIYVLFVILGCIENYEYFKTNDLVCPELHYSIIGIKKLFERKIITNDNIIKQYVDEINLIKNFINKQKNTRYEAFKII